MHIVILADPVDKQKAGIHVYTKKIIENLLKFDKKNTYTFIHTKTNPFFNKTNHYIIPRKPIPGYDSFRRFILIPRLIRRLNPDAVWEPCHIGPFRIPSHIKKILTIHDLTTLLFPQFHTFRNKFIHKLFIKRSIESADLILTPSKTTKKDILRLFKPKVMIASIPLGVDKPKFITKKPSKPYLLYVGTLEPRKNLETLIRAFLELKKSHSLPHQLILAGGIGWKAKPILKLAHSSRQGGDTHKDIIITGTISEDKKSELYTNASLFIYPSLYEGFGLPPLEALSYNLPVITSTGGSLKEIFARHTDQFPPKNCALLKELILKNLKKSPGKTRALSPLPKKLTWEETARKSIETIEKQYS